MRSIASTRIWAASILLAILCLSWPPITQTGHARSGKALK
jgi:hypothetical protein